MQENSDIVAAVETLKTESLGREIRHMFFCRRCGEGIECPTKEVKAKTKKDHRCEWLKNKDGVFRRAQIALILRREGL